MLSFIRTNLAHLRASQENEKGATAVEYGLMVAAIAAVIVGIVFALGSTVQGKFSHTNDCINGTGSVTTGTGSAATTTSC